MCGIFGIVTSKKNSIKQDDILGPLSLLEHRGPDHKDSFVNETVGFAHARLSIFDLSPSAHQPFHSFGSILLFNGAIYNYIEIRDSLKAKGYQFKTNSDTEVVCAAYREWGKDCVKRFNGMWAFALYDEQLKITLCSRDRYGIKPFYYLSQPDRFVFSSEIKAFLNLDGYHAKLDSGTVARYLQTGELCFNQDNFFTDVQTLMPGTQLTIESNGKIHSSTYYDLTNEVAYNKNLNFKDASARFKELFDDAVSLRMRGDVKIGSALSGGLDSAAIVSTVKHKFPDVVMECVSACFEGARYNEQKYISDTIKLTGHLSHKIFPKGDDLIDYLKALSWYHDQPIPSASVIAQNAVFKKAKEQGLKVMLDGQGADEILFGYDSFYKDLVRKNPLGSILRFPLLFGLLKRKRSERSDQLAILKHDFSPTGLPKNIREKAIYMMERSVLPSLLHFEDRNAMMYGIESRVPYLDYRIVNYCLGLPIEYFFHNQHRKYLLKTAVKDRIAPSVYNRTDKMAFAVPQGSWMKNNETASRNALSGLYSYIEDFVDIDGLSNLPVESKLYWRILSFAIWRSRFDSISQSPF